MSVIQNFISATSAVDAAFAPNTARSLVNIMRELRTRANYDGFAAILQQFVTHTENESNPHVVTVVENGRADALDALYGIYTGMATTPLTRSQFDASIVSNPSLFLELLRRVIVNDLLWVDGNGTQGVVPYGADGIVVPSELPRPSYQISPTTTFGVDPTQPIAVPAGDLPFPTGTIVLRATLRKVVDSHTPLVRISNSTEHLELGKVSNTTSTVDAVLVNDPAVWGSPSVLMDAYMREYHASLAEAHAGEIAEFTLELTDPATPSVKDRISYYLDTILPGFPVTDNDAASAINFYYDPHRTEYQDGGAAQPVGPSDSESSLETLPPTGGSEIDAYLALVYSQEEIILYYAHQGKLRSTMAYTYGFAHPPTTLQVGVSLTAYPIAGEDAVRAVQIYPGALSPLQIHDAFASLVGA